MAATYLKITRDEFEDWLYEICPVFERAEKTEGVYFCPMSPYVAVRISTTLGQNDTVIRKDYGRCRMWFVRRDNRKGLRKPRSSSNPDFEQCNRTQGWRVNWTDALCSLFASFKGDRDHYNDLGKQTQKEYAVEWRVRIESVKDWEKFKILKDLHDSLGSPHWLSGKQEMAVWGFVRPRRGRGGVKKATKKRSSTTRKTSGTVDRPLLDALDALVSAAEKADDDWTVRFVTGNVRSRVEAGRDLSSAQAAVLRKKFTKFKITVPLALAA